MKAEDCPCKLKCHARGFDYCYNCIDAHKEENPLGEFLNWPKPDHPVDNRKPVEYDEDEIINSPHFHKFTIPVEWEYGSDRRYDGVLPAYNARHKRVTVLRCECGEETNR